MEFSRFLLWNLLFGVGQICLDDLLLWINFFPFSSQFLRKGIGLANLLSRHMIPYYTVDAKQALKNSTKPIKTLLTGSVYIL